MRDYQADMHQILATHCARGRSSNTATAMLVGAVIAFFFAAGAAHTQNAAQADRLDFDIPAQSLENALRAYGDRVGFQVLYESRSAVDRISTAVRGKFTPETALGLLLSGTDLIVHHTRPDAITLASPRPPPGDDHPPANPLETADLSLGELRVREPGKTSEGFALQEYNDAVRSDIQNAIQKNAKTRFGSYRVVLDVWIDPARIVQKAAVLQSTGDGDRDAAIAEVLRGLIINRVPPPNTPRPVRVAIVVKALK